jgi:peptidoglycan/LPS O-acetylase OafA/YrhL
LTKKHYVVLDGLRGIAAIAVLMLHASFDFHLSRPAHAYLAVDFFFCLSGFVIAHAYDRTLSQGQTTFTAFVRKRIVRLYPMVLAGSALGALVMLISATHSAPMPLWQVGALAASSAALLPMGIAFGLTAFPLDAPLWSLFFEGIANVIYGALAGRAFSRGIVVATLAASALAVVVASVLAQGVVHVGVQGSLWFVGGVARVTFPFLAGMMICRWGLADGPVALPDLAIGGLLAALLLGPSLGPLWLYDAAAILLAFPVVVMVGARMSPSPMLQRGWKFLGDISYPLYAIHEPVLQLVRKFQNHAMHLSSPTAAAVVAMLVSVAVSWLAFRFYDVPVRRWLAAQPRAMRPALA